MNPRNFDINKCKRNDDGHLICKNLKGEYVYIYDTNFKHSICPEYIIAAKVRKFNCAKEYDQLIFFTKDGKVRINDCSDYDLVNIPEKISGFMNVYKLVDNTRTVYFHHTKEDAEKSISKTPLELYIGTYPVEWEE